MSCSRCNKSIRSSACADIKCSICEKSFHGNCVKLGKEELEFFVENKKEWSCPDCLKEKRKTISMEASVSKGEISLNDIIKLLNEIREDNRRMEKDLGRSIESCHTDVEDVLKKINLQEKQLNICLEKIESQTLEIINLKRENCELHKAVSDLQQSARSNWLELHNFPMERNEDVVDIVKSISKALEYPITDQQIDNCHRLTTRDITRPPPILIKLVRKIDKDELLKKRRIKRDFSTRHLGLTTDIPLYLNESLSPERRKILALARKAKVDKGYKYLWIRNGKILMRKTDGQPVIVLETINDLLKLE
jgi:hypothetical protein